ncbi:MAG: hypothetical protein JRN20_15495 [Nitrososphaerota archaeon]|nr:hypothetical protein [Nitrososphaerota archaeon]
MMDIEWWREESWWERGSIPLAGFYVSPRQLIAITIFFILGIAAELPVPIMVNGIPFLGKIAVIGAFVFAGLLLSVFRVKMAPVEMLLLYRLRRRRKKSNTKNDDSKGQPTAAASTAPHRLVVEDDFSQPLPYRISDKLATAPDRLLKLRLLVDGEQRDEDFISPTKTHYRLKYAPVLPKDLGVREITVEVEGQSKPLVSDTLLVEARGEAGLLDMKGKKK